MGRSVETLAIEELQGVLQGYSRGTPGVLQGYSRGTPGVLQGYSRGTAGVLQKHATGTPRVLQGYSRGYSRGSSNGTQAVLKRSARGEPSNGALCPGVYMSCRSDRSESLLSLRKPQTAAAQAEDGTTAGRKARSERHAREHGGEGGGTLRMSPRSAGSSV